MSGVWTPELLELAEAMWRAGVTARVIAEAVGRTRNAVIGKAHRLEWGLHGGCARGRQEAAQMRRERGEQRSNPEPVVRRRVVAKARVKAPVAPVAAIAPREPEIVAGPVGLLRLSSRRCRWPVSGEGAGMLFCGVGTITESVYCAEHHARSYQRGRAA